MRKLSRIFLRGLQKLNKKISKVPVLVSSLPKAGTIYLLESLSYGLFKKGKIPSCGVFPNYYILSYALLEIINNGGVSVSHIPPNRYNFDIIENLTDRMIVHVRDPRQATLSWIEYFKKLPKKYSLMYGYDEHYEALGQDDKIRYMRDKFYKDSLEFIKGWVDLSENPGSKVQILIKTNEELSTNPIVYFNSILDFYDIPREMFILPPPPVVGEKHFRKGQVGEWRHRFPDREVEAYTNMIPHRLRERFGWL